MKLLSGGIAVTRESCPCARKQNLHSADGKIFYRQCMVALLFGMLSESLGEIDRHVDVVAVHVVAAGTDRRKSVYSQVGIQL